MRSCADARIAVLVAALACTSALAAATPKESYLEARGREDLLRRELEATQTHREGSPLLPRIRSLVAQYERIARRFPTSGYSDNALFQGALLAADAYWQFGEDRDRLTALRLLEWLTSQYPASSLNRGVSAHVKRLQAATAPAATAPAATVPAAGAPPAAPTPADPKNDERALLRAIRREVLPDALRVTLELERETLYHDERIDGPPRVFLDLQKTRVADDLRDATLGFPDDVVRQIRVGRHPGGVTRVVLDLQGAARHSVYTLYQPYRIVIDFERAPQGARGASPAASAPDPAGARDRAPAGDAKGHVRSDSATGAGSTTASKTTEPAADAPGASWTAASGPAAGPPVEARTPPVEVPAPAAPRANAAGGFSIARQLGLGISRVVIDAGHGGHDPGARVKGLNEADVTLDIAVRLEALLSRVPGVEVVMTRRTNVYVPLEERTAIANRAAADLFLSIHVNASRNPRARGIETYYLNFAPNPEAEAIAARENAGSARTMHHLPDIVKAIAMNNKIDESRDVAALIQAAMMERLQKRYSDVKSLGVKQAPFMVLIGATMPSVLAEISFVTNRQEASRLRTAAYRQAVAEALFDGIARYQKALKAAQTVAAQ